MTTITDRIDNTTRIPPGYLKAAPPAPKSVKIEISPRCNYRCGFCALRTREVQPKWDMDFGLFKRITREMRAAGVEEVGVFYLGESFMNPRLLVDCIAYLKSGIGMPYVFLTSNASMAFPEAVEACMNEGLDSLKWSVNAADEKYVQAVALAAVPALKAPPTLVLAPGWFRPKRVVDAAIQKPMRVRLLEVIERGNDFERVAYEVLPE